MTEPTGNDRLIREAVDASCPPLGDIGRARIGARVLAEINAPQDRPSEPMISRKRALGLVVAAAAACIAVGWWMGSSSNHPVVLTLAESTGSLASESEPTESELTTTDPEIPKASTSQLSPSEPDVIVAKAGEQITTQIGRARLTLFGPGEMSISKSNDAHQTVTVEAGTVLGSSGGETLVLVDANRTQTITGSVIAVRVERGTVVASARTETSVARVFRSELLAHRQTDLKVAAIPETDVLSPLTETKTKTKTKLEPESATKTKTETETETADSDVAESASTGEGVDAGLGEPSSSALYADSEAAMKRGDLRAAESHLEKLVAKYPDSFDAALAAYDLALLAYRGGRHAEAIKRLDSILANPSHQTRHRVAKQLRCRAVASRDGLDSSDC